MNVPAFVCAFAFLLINFVDVDGAPYRRGRRFRLRRPHQRMMRFYSGRRVPELTIDQNNLRAMCESKITPIEAVRRTMQTRVGGKSVAFLEGQGIDKKLLCKSKFYDESKKDGVLVKHETDGTAMISNEDNVHKLLDESNKARPSDKPREFSVEAESSVVFGQDKKNRPNSWSSSNVKGSAEGLNGIGFKSKTRSSTMLLNRRKSKMHNLMEMDHSKESDFELEV